MQIFKSLAYFFKTKYIRVWHEDSPGMKVVVRRNFLQDLIFCHNFSSCSERYLYGFSDIDLDEDRTK